MFDPFSSQPSTSFPFELFFSVLYFSCTHLTAPPAHCREHCMPVEVGKSVQFSNHVQLYPTEHPSGWGRRTLLCLPGDLLQFCPIVSNRRSWLSSSSPPHPTAGKSCLLTLRRTGSFYHIFKHGASISFANGFHSKWVEHLFENNCNADPDDVIFPNIRRVQKQ